MTIFDIAVSVILGLCCLSSLSKGMIREILSLSGYLTGYITAVKFHDQLAFFIQSLMAEEFIGRISGIPIIFIVLKILLGLNKYEIE